MEKKIDREDACFIQFIEDFCQRQNWCFQRHQDRDIKEKKIISIELDEIYRLDND